MRTAIFAASIKRNRIRDIDKDLVREFKYHRIHAIQKKKGSEGGVGYEAEVAVLHRVFQFAVETKMIGENP
jgi:hypothetical protein